MQITGSIQCQQMAVLVNAHAQDRERKSMRVDMVRRVLSTSNSRCNVKVANKNASSKT